MLSLEHIHSSEDVKKLNREELVDLCAQLRKRMIDVVSRTGGHLASNLGTVELTVALHRAFTTPHDAIVWDVGHQCYAHKLLTDRYEDFDRLRQQGGVSGFPNPAESEHDAFVAGHSSTSISVANGIAKAKALTGDDGYTVAVIGDGALTGGLAYEGLSNAGRSEDRLIVVLNDNKMSISRNVGFMARYLSGLRSRKRYVHSKQRTFHILMRIPLIGKPLIAIIQWIKDKLKRSVLKGTTFFEDMGFRYLGPVDGHNLDALDDVLNAARSMKRPVVVHVNTVKGKGSPYAEQNPDTYHGISRFDPDTGIPLGGGESFSSRFGQAICDLAEGDDRIVAVTAAMVKGTCLDAFAEKYPTRFFDTGIAEEHAVTFSSGMARGGLLPVFAVYSTFLQRAYDQLINDTSLMNNHVVLAIDRAGVVPDDGETHQGIYDVAMLATVPNTTLYAPATFSELELHLKQALYDTDGIAAVRYPKGGEDIRLADYTPQATPTLWDEDGEETLLVTYGRTYAEVAAYAAAARAQGRSVSVLKLNRVLPLTDDIVTRARRYRCVLVLEEARGGVGELLGSALAADGYQGRYGVRSIEETLGACTTPQGLHRLGLDAEGVADFVSRYTEDL